MFADEQHRPDIGTSARLAGREIAAIPFYSMIRTRLDDLESGLQGLPAVAPMRTITRRGLLWTGAWLPVAPAVARPASDEMVYRFATHEWNIRMSIESFDRYSSNGFWFKDQIANNRFCLSGAGRENRKCVPNFSGAIAIARYHIQPRSQLTGSLALREQVRTIDHDSHTGARPPFEHTIELEGGVASDIQAFGYETKPSSSSEQTATPASAPWCLLRQDLYLGGEDSPFLVLHWKHTLSDIRLLDAIPGDGTLLISEPGVSRRGAK